EGVLMANTIYKAVIEIAERREIDGEHEID
ncbi:unnamed protein product, partial [marine sediment metagenome]